MSRLPRVLTIAGSDSSGGAGVQADLKVFVAHNVYGLCAITAITAQNTLGIKKTHIIPPEIVEEQIEAVTIDIGVDSVKTGMLGSKETIKVVAEKIEKHNIQNLVVDPVMKATTGAKLLGADAINVLIEELLPLAKIVTPNILEAEKLSRIKIKTVSDMAKAAKKICETLGVEAVLVTGGDMQGEQSVDLLHQAQGETTKLVGQRVKTKNTHGTGCTLSAAIAANLAKGQTIEQAVKNAKNFVSDAIEHALSLGNGAGPVNPVATLQNEAEKFRVYQEVYNSAKRLASIPNVASHIPEVSSNLVMALPHARSVKEVFGFPSRIIRVENSVVIPSCPKLGGSNHMARVLLAAMKKHPEIRAALNIRYSEKTLGKAEKLGFTITSFTREEEPVEVSGVEGETLPWGVKKALDKTIKAPDIIYDTGGVLSLIHI